MDDSDVRDAIRLAALKATLEANDRVTFDPGNKVAYMQDFSFYRGVPANIPFRVEWLDSYHTRAKLIAFGYGERATPESVMMDEDHYGNGAIFIALGGQSLGRKQ